jgi:beta-D-xylosidase 4
VNALIWGGYPGQSGGTALANIITGVTAPAGRLPLTQYPADYINEVLMTNMALRPSSSSPGRTYKWYTGTPVFEFGAGLHYTNFSLSWAAAPPTSFNIAKVVAAAQAEGGFIDLAVLHNFTLKVANTGAVASDYVALLFSNTTAGPQPAPLRELVSFTRVKDVQPGQSASAVLTVTLGQIARADENGNSVLYPGTYELWVDTTAKVKASFTLTGKQTQIVAFPQPS